MLKTIQKVSYFLTACLLVNCSSGSDDGGETTTSVVKPVSENGTVTNLGGIAIANVLSNDTTNGVQSTVSNSIIKQSGTWPAGITLNTNTGAITVAAGTNAGTYSVIYQLIDKNKPTVSATATDIITVTPSVTYTDEQVMDKVQKDAFNYFWDTDKGTHPVCMMAKERYHTDDPSNDKETVTTGGTGFGFMTILVGVERTYITRAEALTRLTTAVDFLTNNVTKYHGAFPHWFNGSTGATLQGTGGVNDNGGDLIETSFLCEGLICVREYFKNGTTQEKALAAKADALIQGVEWDWYTQGQKALYWHWSPTAGFAINMKIDGYNEGLIPYVLAATSTTHTIDRDTYTQGWTRSGAINNGGSAYGIPLVVNHNGASGTVGPMFFSHYSFMGLDPNGLSDGTTNYGDLTKNHAKIMYQYCQAQTSRGYNEKIWGLTASYSPDGYAAHQPNNDLGVISPTAALASMPYTPTESLKFLHFLYEERPSTLVGNCGPYDAFKPSTTWVSPRYLAIDQGPIAPMIENHRSGLLWKLFMNAPDVKAGLVKLGFTSKY